MGFLSKIFKSNRPDNLSKVDYWKKWEFFELLDDLHAAEKILAEYKGRLLRQIFYPLKSFMRHLLDAIDDIEFGNQTDLSRFWTMVCSDWRLG